MKTQKKIIVLFVFLFTSLLGCLSYKPPHSTKLVFVSNRDGDFDIYMIDIETKEQINLTNNSSDDLLPNFSPDGEQIVFVSNRDRNFEIYKMSADGNYQTRLTNNSSSDSYPIWSPDGKSIVFISDQDGVVINKNKGILKSEIYIMDSNGFNLQRLTNDLVFYRSASWVNGVNDIVVCANVPTPTEKYYFDQLYFLKDFKMLTDTSYNSCDPTVSPNGKQILFVSNQDGGSNIYIVNIDGSNLSALTTAISYNIDPNWSPDGNQIVFASRRDGNYNIYVMDIDGSNIIQLTDDISDDYMPAWLPNK
jgi:TolB protein